MLYTYLNHNIVIFESETLILQKRKAQSFKFVGKMPIDKYVYVCVLVDSEFNISFQLNLFSDNYYKYIMLNRFSYRDRRCFILRRWEYL